MTQRQAKSKARRMIAALVMGQLEAGWPFEYDPENMTEADQERLRVALVEIADALTCERGWARRGG